ncbi:MAG: hypothetical protein Q3962_01360 [Corynebacterium sp.]|nr:hypothetical protein [Corynebacterium sp.]
MKKLAKISATIALCFTSLVAPAHAEAYEVPQYTDQELLDSGISQDELSAFRQYLDDEAFYGSDEFQPYIPQDRSWGSDPAPDSRVGNGLKNTSYFHLANADFTQGNEYIMTGYSGKDGLRSVPTWAHYEAFYTGGYSYFDKDHHHDWANLVNIVGVTGKKEANATGKQPDGSCSGDSGSAIRQGDLIYGVLSGGIGEDGKCGQYSLAARTITYKAEIENIMRTNRKVSMSENCRAFRGTLWGKHNSFPKNS